jgi:glycosyltransferase involved in cell wall biosynthesis
MHIAIDAHQLGTQLAGNATYISNLIEALAKIDDRNRYTLFVTQDTAIERHQNLASNFAFKKIRARSPFVRIPISLPLQLLKDRADILFVQYTAPPLVQTPVVTAIHDISYEHLPETFDRRSRFQMKLTIRHTAKRAAHILAPSEFSRRDIMRTYKVEPGRISTIPLAASDVYRPAVDGSETARVKLKYGISGEYILGVGSIQPRKNLVRLMQAYALLLKKGHDLPPLVLAGRKAWLSDETVEADVYQTIEDRVIFTGFVPDEDLPALYSGAICFVYPSFFEGFGLPPLEAMQCGTPVIAGDRTSLPEVVGDAGILVDPHSVDAIAAALEKVLADPRLRAELRQRGLERAKCFSWDRTARQTLDIFERIANK